MKHAINSIYKVLGTGIIAFGFILAVRAAGLADLGGDFSEVYRTTLCGFAAMGIGAFIRGWKV